MSNQDKPTKHTVRCEHEDDISNCPPCWAEFNPHQDSQDELRAKILNEGSIPRRKQLVDNLIEEVDMQGYKRGFKEAEAMTQKAVTEARIDELQNWPDTFRRFGTSEQRLYDYQDKIIQNRIAELKGDK